MRCKDCRRLMSRHRHEWLDANHDVTIRVWRCAGCDTGIEEIRIQPERCGMRVRVIRYAVRPWTNAA